MAARIDWQPGRMISNGDIVHFSSAPNSLSVYKRIQVKPTAQVQLEKSSINRDVDISFNTQHPRWSHWSLLLRDLFLKCIRTCGGKSYKDRVHCPNFRCADYARKRAMASGRLSILYLSVSRPSFGMHLNSMAGI